jgi:hypothetical protein
VLDFIKGIRSAVHNALRPRNSSAPSERFSSETRLLPYRAKRPTAVLVSLTSSVGHTPTAARFGQPFSDAPRSGLPPLVHQFIVT